VSEGRSRTRPQARILVRSDVCSGCRACTLACVAAHEGGFGSFPARIKVTKIETEGLDVPAVCRLCRRPACAAACPTGALTRDDVLGVVRLDEAECIACGACADGCPFGMVTIRPSDGLPLICDLCDGDPSCVKRCASGAIRWGGTDEPAREKREILARRHLADQPAGGPAATTSANPPGGLGGPTGVSGVPSAVYRANRPEGKTVGRTKSDSPATERGEV
jgi:Fe-S-cluster-containing dehydrogenase component